MKAMPIRCRPTGGSTLRSWPTDRILRLYRNGREVAASPMAGLFIAPPKRLLTIGCLDNRSVDAPNMEPANFWRGNLDELAIFHRALSTHEIRELFKGQRLEKTTSIPSGKEMP